MFKQAAADGQGVPPGNRGELLRSFVEAPLRRRAPKADRAAVEGACLDRLARRRPGSYNAGATRVYGRVLRK
jgi:hypothetical protein